MELVSISKTNITNVSMNIGPLFCNLKTDLVLCNDCIAEEIKDEQHKA